jgi:hypothetical protein
MTYAVIAPTKTINGTAVLPVFVTDDVDAAKSVARRRYNELTAKGWDSWAKQIKVQSPADPAAYMELADKVAEYGHSLDWASQGNSFKGQEMINWANILRVRADEMHNPEAYA